MCIRDRAQDDPLALGMVDALAKVGIPAFGPDKAEMCIRDRLGAEVLLAELDVPQIHGQTLFLDELGKACLIQLVEARCV